MAEIISFAEKKAAKIQKELLQKKKKEAEKKVQKAFHHLVNDILSGVAKSGDIAGIVQNPAGIEFRETERSLYIKLNLKHFEKENIKIRVADHMLYVDLMNSNLSNGVSESSETLDDIPSGEKMAGDQTAEIKSMSQCIPLPFSIEKKQVRAKFKEGFLYVDLPRAEKSSSNEIQIPVE